MTQNVNNEIVRKSRTLTRLIGALMLLVVAGGNAMAQTIGGSVYGGGNQAGVKVNTAVNIYTGQVNGNVYGGGNVGSVGTYETSTDMKTFEFTANTGECNVTISGGTIGTGVAMSADGTFANGNVYGAGKGLDDTYWCEKAMTYKTNVTINAGTVNGTVYGGGQIGRVENNATVTIGVETPANNTVTPTITGNVFGAGAGLVTHGYSALLRGNTEVTVQGYAQVGLSVFGGGEIASVGRFKIVGGLPSEPQNGGTCKVTVKGNAKIGTSGTDHHVFGSCQGVAAPASLTAYDTNYKSMQAVAQKAPEGTENTAWEYVEGSTEYYWEYYPTLDAYKDFLKTLALASHTDVEIGGSAAVFGSVFGGGQMGITLGNVAVDINGGTVEHDVYGGGALADTNKGNQTAEKYDVATVTPDVTVVTGMYERSGDVGNYTYTLIETAGQKAETGKTYYTRAAQSSINTTTVNLTGGLIKGDAYGGGLGQKTGFNSATSDIAATVYGDISLNLGSDGGATATAFQTSYYTGAHADVVKSGRVFGCNNLLGSPQGNVTVTVYRTVTGKDGAGENLTRTAVAKKKLKEGDTGYVPHTYEVAAVYGGGNLANYTAAGKKASVTIYTCEVSVQSVYGGGNAAEVPETDVLVRGAYEIDEVFGGGNGKDPYTTDNGTSWVTNPGANIGNSTNPGDANTLLTGGLIHAAYGGSNEKGTIFGNVKIDIGVGGDCTLDVEKMVGAGKNADVNGNLIMILGCKPSAKIPVLYAGADQANVNGNVELTITSGNYGKVFGGNNLSGAIRGHIKLNIEETGDCETPITIDELYLGGNEAAYSIYGYYVETTTSESDGGVGAPTETAVLTAAGKLHLIPRISASDTHLPVMSYSYDETDGWSWTVYDGTTEEKTFTPYTQPEMNVISCTYIGKVFGGGYGTGAALYGDPIVNINMIPGSHAEDIHTFMSSDSRLTSLSLPSTDNPNNLGIIGDVYGGGNAADIIGNPTVNIGTAATVTLTSVDDDPATTDVNEHTPAVVGAYIVGNVFGGGMGDDDNFFCNKAMIGKDGDGVDNPTGGTTVNIYNGTVRGNVYGGGEIGRVEKNTVVTIGTGDGVAPGGTLTSAPVIMGNVFGGGKGKETHGYAALVRGNPTVTIQGNAKVMKSVYGGGEIASVARYNVPKTEAEVEAAIAAGYTEAVLGMPYALANTTSGNCTVTVRGYAEIGPDGMQMTASGGPDDTGYVFGAGKGILPGSTYAFDQGTTRRMVLYDATVHTTVGQSGSKWQWVDPAHSDTNKNVWEYFDDLDEYIRFIQTLALSSYTDVTIDGNAFVKGSVYGGSENGIVQFDTDVKIQGGQIGNGDGVNARYTNWDVESLAECASWTFEAPYAPYDPYANASAPLDKYSNGASTEGGRHIATDGHTYYGNVFGGGSGSVPYFDNTLGRSVYLHSAGQVKGDTYVTITGGHILTNVYGGCEATNVNGTANVTMKGGTIGVPRTDAQIIAHPVTGYLFGGGKGDQRVFFNKDTNVKDAVVIVEGGRIYGSVYGGGEDGHVLRNTTVTIKETDATNYPTKIGTEGTSYYDGNVFGGGRGFGGDALTAGNVGGSVTLNIEAGEILGSVYGGGRLASVGYGLYLTTETGYGIIRADNEYDGSYTNPSTEDAGDFFTLGRGRIIMNITGGTIGNDNEYTYDANNELTHTKGGNVFAGGMGRMYQLDGTTPISSLDWWKLGCVKSTTLTISGDAVIKSCVYGGGELGQVVGYHSAKNAANEDVNVGTEVIINGGTIGTEIKQGETVKYTFGSVFGGGYGSLEETLTHTGGKPDSYPKYIGGRVLAGTKVNMTAGTVRASVYGGGEMAAVGESRTLGETLTAGYTGDTHVIISGGFIGKDKVGTTYFGGAKMGNVYGGGSGSNNTVRSGHVYGNTNVTISNGTIYHNVYGGGAYGSVGDFTYSTGLDEQTGTYKVNGISGLHTEHSSTGVARVTITGGTIGINGKENGMVFGSSRGDINKPGERDDYTAWVYDTHVTIGTEGAETGPAIKGSVYGSGENGHTYHDAETIIHSGTIGITSGEDITYTENGQSVTKGGAAYPYRGNVYGGGCGTDKYDSNNDNVLDSFNPLAGIVYGNATVTIDGGQVTHNIYGAGAMGSVGKITTTGSVTTISGGQTTITISGGTIGVSGTVGDGNVFGAARGDADATSNAFALVRDHTTVSISGGEVKGNVYGGGELGCVGTYVFTTDMKNFYWTNEELVTNKTTYTYNNTGVCNVTITNGTIGTGVEPSADGTYANGNVYGAGKGLEDTWWCEKAIAYKTNVTVTDGTINGTVYGGGQVGRVETDAIVTIGTADEEGTSNKPNIIGNVFGAGAGVKTHGYSALVRGNATVTVQGIALVGGSVYGGGEIASVGRFTVEDGLPKHPDSGGTCTVTIQDHAKIGASGTTHNVFGACKGVTPPNVIDATCKSMQTEGNVPDGATWEYVTSYPKNYPGTKFIWVYYPNITAYLDFLETLALTSHPIVTIAEDATVNGSVFGGGERGITLGSVEVNLNGGTVEQDVYGGGSLANSNKGNWETSTNTWADGKVVNGKTEYTTTVNLHSGIINGTVYGGGLGQLGDNPIEAKVYGDVLVKLNETIASDDCFVKGNVFGCNNVNGTPMSDVTVHVYKTVKKGNTGAVIAKPTKETNTYELAAVYGGGNQAAYDPENANNTRQTEVIIDGCALTSIEYVYGGGNAAAAPATHVTVNSCYEIGTVFAGGNGAGDGNPGANVGYKNDGTTSYGAGTALAELKGGTIHQAFGGSNSRGNVRTSATAALNEADPEGCPLCIDEIYGGGNEAYQDGTSNIDLGCISYLSNIYGGSKNADINNDIVLTIQSGRFNRVFGGNNLGGNITGTITVNIEETGCHPIIIGQLFGGGNQAAYTAPSGKHGPTVNVKSFTSIGEIYGGGYGANATVTGDTYVNINVCMGNNTNAETDVTAAHTNKWIHFVAGKNPDDSDKIVTVWQPEHTPGSIGTIGNVFGGGNEAGVDGNTNVQIGLLEYVYVEITSNIVAGTTDVRGYYTFNGTKYTEVTGNSAVPAVADTKYYKKVIGANITGNVYGGGNAAVVTGDTNVKIGTKE